VTGALEDQVAGVAHAEEIDLSRHIKIRLGGRAKSFTKGPFIFLRRIASDKPKRNLSLPPNVEYGPRQT